MFTLVDLILYYIKAQADHTLGTLNGNMDGEG